jgi:hypothetical protein
MSETIHAGGGIPLPTIETSEELPQRNEPSIE